MFSMDTIQTNITSAKVTHTLLLRIYTKITELNRDRLILGE